MSDLEDDCLNPSFFNSKNKYVINQCNFDKIPGSPIAYWADKHVFEAFEKGTPLFELSDIKQGLATADNNRFLKFWFEVDYHKIGFSYESCVASKNSNLKWFPCNKGGKYKKWYGNQIEVINFQNGAEELRNFKKANAKLAALESTGHVPPREQTTSS